MILVDFNRATLSTKRIGLPFTIAASCASGCRLMTDFATLFQPATEFAALRKNHLRDTTQDASARALESFLAEVERKAFRIAQIALRHEDDALDAVQDAMLQLAHRYASRPAAEWKPLFYRILENRIRDMQRRRSVRNRIIAWMPWYRDDEDGGPDPIEQAADPSPSPVTRLESDEMLSAIETALERLPPRQRQAFVLRNFEGLDVAGTATAMKCSQGSVKTHYFRAIQSLREQLGEFWK
jgi:RNA polymerase sigma-70 factor (ECF subfamily)